MTRREQMTCREPPSNASRMASISASMRRRISWGAVEVIPDGAGGAEQAWHSAGPALAAEVCIPSLPPGAPPKKEVQRPETARETTTRLPTPCRNLRTIDGNHRSQPQKPANHIAREASPIREVHQFPLRPPDQFLNREREQLLNRISELERQRNSLEMQRNSLQTNLDQADRREALQEQVVQRVREQIECGVCLLPFCWPVTLDCGHSFCRSCIADWENKQRGQGTQSTCPACRAAVRSSRPAHALHNVCVAFEDPTAACRRTQEDPMYQAICEAKTRDPSMRRITNTANRRRSSMVFMADGHEVTG